MDHIRGILEECKDEKQFSECVLAYQLPIDDLVSMFNAAIVDKYSEGNLDDLWAIIVSYLNTEILKGRAGEGTTEAFGVIQQLISDDQNTLKLSVDNDYASKKFFDPPLEWGRELLKILAQLFVFNDKNFEKRLELLSEESYVFVFSADKLADKYNRTNELKDNVEKDIKMLNELIVVGDDDKSFVKQIERYYSSRIIDYINNNDNSNLLLFYVSNSDVIEDRLPETHKEIIDSLKITLEQIDVDESTVTTCFDILELDDIDVKEYLKNNDSYIFINGDVSMCSNKEEIDGALEDMNDNWFFDCIGDFIKGTGDKNMEVDSTKPYLKLRVDNSGLNGFIPVSSVMGARLSNHKIFHIVPMLDEKNIQRSFTHSISYRNALTKDKDYVSANHCQAGSTILLYDLKVCGGDKCIS